LTARVRGSRFVAVAFAGFVLGLLAPVAANERSGLDDACVRSGSPESCETLGALIERGELRRAYPEEAGLYFGLACEGGRSSACSRAQPWAKRYSDYEAFEVDVGCMLKHNAFACEELAGTLREEVEEGSAGADMVPVARARMRRALALYLDGCGRNDAESCLGASRVHSAGFGVAWNPRDASAEAARACALGLAAACELLGDDRTGSEAVASYRRASELAPGAPHAHLKLARAEEAAKVPPETVALDYRKACELLSFDACLWVSQKVEHLDGESPGVVAAFRRWCASGSPRACELVNRLHAE
jgi:TPR repeat protein